MDEEKLERLRKKSEEARLEHERREAMFRHGRKPSNKKWLVLGAVLAAFLLLALGVYSLTTGPGSYDDFADCMKEKGAVIYGNDFCSYTQRQKTYFGKSFKRLNYVRCADYPDLCKTKGIQVTPTWEVSGKMYPEVQTFERLSAISGCAIQ